MSGHDIDLLISHPDEGTERGILTQLMEQLDRSGLVLHGGLSRSTFSDDVLHSDTVSNLVSTMDHFEKWMGILKINNKFKENCVQQSEKSGTEANKDTVVPPSCKLRQNEGQSPGRSTQPDSVDLAKCRFERQPSLDAAFQMSKSQRDWVARRVDLIVSPASQYYYALVGWTGNKHFNR